MLGEPPSLRGPTQPMTDISNDGAPNGAATLQIAAQYIRDLSFENPSTPGAQHTGKPVMQVAMDVQARATGADQYEVGLRVRVDAKSGETPVYLVELLYAGLFIVKGASPETLQPILLIECPRILFPFARRVVADVTRDGGFMPLMLDPIDFAAMFRQQMASRAGQVAQAPQA